jgi:hypothetical protein
MAFIETCLRNVWLLKIKSAIGPLSIIGASTLLVDDVGFWCSDGLGVRFLIVDKGKENTVVSTKIINYFKK